MNTVVLTEDQALQGATFPVEVKCYLNGSQIKPSAATVTIKDEEGTALVSAASMAIDATTGTLTYTLAATATADLAENMVMEIDYTGSDGAHQAMFFFDVVLQKLTPNVTNADLKAFYPQLGDELWADEVGYTAQIDEAFRQVKRLIKDKGKRPAMLLDGSQVRELVIIKTFEMLFFNFAKNPEDVWWARYLKYQALFTERFASLVVKYDEDESGTIEEDEEVGFTQARLER